MDHLSSSQIDQYLRCPLKYRYQRIDRIQPTFVSSALVFGGAIHAALEWMHGELMRGKELSLDTACRIFNSDWYSQKLDLPIRFKEDEDEASLFALGKEMLRQYAAMKHGQVKGCEVAFTVPLVHPETREDLGVTLDGYIDTVEADPEGGDAIVEYKTSGQTFSQNDIDVRLQLTAYSYAYATLHRKIPKSFKVVTFLKYKKPRIHVVETTRCEKDHIGFFEVAKGVLNGIRAGVFPPHPGFWCGDCEYRAICPLWQRSKEQQRKEKEVAANHAMAQLALGR
jgi:putative RecB family exonuclease